MECEWTPIKCYQMMITVPNKEVCSRIFTRIVDELAGEDRGSGGRMSSVQWGHSTQAWLHIPAAAGACRKR